MGVGVRIRVRVRIAPVLRKDPPKIRCSDHPFVFSRPQVCTYLSGGDARAKVRKEEEEEEQGNKRGEDLVLSPSEDTS